MQVFNLNYKISAFYRKSFCFYFSEGLLIKASQCFSEPRRKNRRFERSTLQHWQFATNTKQLYNDKHCPLSLALKLQTFLIEWRKAQRSAFASFFLRYRKLMLLTFCNKGQTDGATISHSRNVFKEHPVSANN